MVTIKIFVMSSLLEVNLSHFHLEAPKTDFFLIIRRKFFSSFWNIFCFSGFVLLFKFVMLINVQESRTGSQ